MNDVAAVEPASVTAKRLRSTASGVMQREAMFRVATQAYRDDSNFRRQRYGYFLSSL